MSGAVEDAMKDRTGGGRSARKPRPHLPFIALAAVFALTSWSQFDSFPVWDGFAFFRHCYMSFAETGSPECFGHSAIFNTLLFGMTQKLWYGSYQAVYALNVLLGLAGLAAFALLLRHLYGDVLSDLEAALVTGCLVLNPVFLAHVVQPSLDYALTVYVAALLLALSKRRFNAAAAAGYLLILTKENGIMLYCLTATAYLAALFAGGKRNAPRPRFRDVHALIFPVIIFVGYMAFFPPHQHQVFSWEDVASRMLSFNPSSIIFQEQLLSLYVLNFGWAVSAVIALGLGKKLLGYAKNGASLRALFDGKIHLYALALLLTYFNTRIELANNPRYMLPLLPLMLVLFADSLLSLTRRKAVRILVAACLCALVFLSAFRTFDPVSKAAYGTFGFGAHEMLRMERGGWGRAVYGRDQLVYNYEFTKFGSLMEKAVREFGTGRVYALPASLSFADFEDFCSYDRETGRRSAVPGRTVNATCVSDVGGAGEFYLPKFPLFAYRLHPSVDAYYAQTGEIRFEEDGYALNVTRYTAMPGTQTCRG
jgi:hypothetical protein